MLIYKGGGDMITYSTQFPISKEYTKDVFITMVIRWNQGSKYDKFDSLSWDEKTYQLKWEEEKKRLTINDFEEIGVIASRLKKEDEHGLWRTDFILNYAKNYLTVRVTLETTEFTTEFSPSYYPPFFVKKVIYEGYAGDDYGLPVSNSTFVIDKDNKSFLVDLVSRSLEVSLPVVVVTQTSEGIMPLELGDLAFRLQGVAHVLEEGEPGLFSDIHFCEEDDKKPGKIYLIFPNKNMRVRIMNLSGEKADNPDLIISRIVNEIYGYTNQILRLDVDTWEGIQTENLHRQNASLLSDQKAIEEENEELYEVFEEQLKKTEKNNKDLNKQVQRLTVENQALRMKLASLDKVPALYLGEERDFYTGEIREIILEILSEYQRNYLADTRRDHIIKDLIENNQYEQIPAKRREQLKKILKGYRTLTGSLKNELEAMGFEISDDGKHYKWSYYGDHRYVETVAKTSSDSRAGMNIASSIDNLML
jgi:CRISPR/Cas system CSM-associated protein Csm2 small subunit